jgi:UDP-N-acetylmuramoyl-L-alanyl-D-glutamate--2,6-diaminopimelate ligase
VVYDVAVFLNLGRDHLDFHPTMEDYFAAKASLFTPGRARRGLVNVDDEWIRGRLAGSAEIPVDTFSMGTASIGAVSVGDRRADWVASDIEPHPTGSRFRVTGPGVSLEARSPIPGGFNVQNTLAAIATSGLAGYDVRAVARAIAEGPGVAGRFERLDEGQDFGVVVDYAHKPDALDAALATLRPLTAGRLIVVLGAGGDRDHGKRPLMGEIAARLGDVVIVTDDNPRSEDPATIRRAILDGAAHGEAEMLEIGDRRAAIAEAVGRAGAGDTILIAGKGHEPGQEVAGVVHPFDDRLVAREELRR